MKRLLAVLVALSFGAPTFAEEAKPAEAPVSAKAEKRGKKAKPAKKEKDKGAKKTVERKP